MKRGDEWNDRHGYSRPTLAQYDALRAENERLRVLLGIDQWGPDIEPANIREIAATEVRKFVAAERDALAAKLAIAQARIAKVGSQRDMWHAHADRLSAALADPEREQR